MAVPAGSGMPARSIVRKSGNGSSAKDATARTAKDATARTADRAVPYSREPLEAAFAAAIVFSGMSVRLRRRNGIDGIAPGSAVRLASAIVR